MMTTQSSMRKRLQRAAAIGMAAILCIQNAQFGLTTFADELSDFARMEGIMNAQAMRMTPANSVKNLSGGCLLRIMIQEKTER